MIHDESCLVGMKELLSFNLTTASDLILLSSSALFCTPHHHHEAPFWGELECLKKRLSLKRLNFSVILLLPFSTGVSKKGIWLCG